MNLFYTYRQNNSGGNWVGPVYVIVEAASPEEADDIACAHGVYFNGVKEGWDCACCGDRWISTCEWDAYDSPGYYEAGNMELGAPTKGKTLIVYADGHDVTL